MKKVATEGNRGKKGPLGRAKRAGDRAVAFWRSGRGRRSSLSLAPPSSTRLSRLWGSLWARRCIVRPRPYDISRSPFDSVLIEFLKKPKKLPTIFLNQKSGSLWVLVSERSSLAPVTCSSGYYPSMSMHVRSSAFDWTTKSASNHATYLAGRPLAYTYTPVCTCFSDTAPG